MEKKGQIPVAVIFAPTACGKTALVQNIFGEGSLSRFKGTGEIISADSQAVYRHMDIGTAKPTEAERNALPHHLIDVLDPDRQFGAGEFVAEADRLCREIYGRGKLPVVTGGTGFYIRSFMLGLPSAPESNPELREKIKQRLKTEGNASLYHELKKADPEYAKKIDIHDGYRICRALEVWYSTGKKLSSFELPENPRDEYSFCAIMLRRDREELYGRIDRRVEEMFRAGLAREVENLMAMGYGADSPGMKAIGYREFFECPGADEKSLIRTIQRDSRRYAKKQYTYMKGLCGMEADADDTDAVKDILSAFCRREHFPAGW